MIYVNKNYIGKRWMLPTAFASSFHHILFFSFILVHVYLSYSCFRQCYILTTTGTYNLPPLLLTNSVRQTKLREGQRFPSVQIPNQKQKWSAVVLMKRLPQFTASYHLLSHIDFFFHVVLALYYDNGWKSSFAEMRHCQKECNVIKCRKRKLPRASSSCGI